MATDTRSELQDFQTFLTLQLAGGDPPPSLEECLELWREQREVLAAIREGIAESDAGLGRPYGEVIDELLARNRAASAT